MEMGLGPVLAAGDDVSAVWAARHRKGTGGTHEPDCKGVADTCGAIQEVGTMPWEGRLPKFAEADNASTGEMHVALLAGRRGGVGAAYDQAGAGEGGTNSPPSKCAAGPGVAAIVRGGRNGEQDASSTFLRDAQIDLAGVCAEATGAATNDPGAIDLAGVCAEATGADTNDPGLNIRMSIMPVAGDGAMSRSRRSCTWCGCGLTS